jgi:HK97 family phage prohead protease
MKVKNVPIGQVKAGPDDGLEEGQFLVYPSTFTREPDAYGDVVAPGAFLDDIAAWKASGNVLPGLYGHRMDDPDFFVAGAIDEGEDEHGWWVKGEFDLDNPKARQVYRLVKGRRLNQLSFAYDVLEEGKVELGNGETANELRKLKRYEFSFVPVGANQDTGVVAVKSTVEAMLKEGRVLSAKNETALREARDAIDSVLASLGDGNEDQGKASGDAEAKPGASDEDPSGGKSSVPGEELKRQPSVDTFLAVINIEQRS